MINKSVDDVRHWFCLFLLFLCALKGVFNEYYNLLMLPFLDNLNLLLNPALVCNKRKTKFHVHIFSL